ncbi:MAG: hypothetical protein A2Z83_07835 [Omnitrophica bacterium GWA2_52_8]|nr:MAG: hypothetical protein A2Z83_07835 [Omnitrophica bacterium GWA2_52_8]
MSARKPLHLFDAYGIELEYMLVDRRSLSVMPVADELLKKAHGRYTNDHTAAGGIGWSNELVCHVLELRNERPEPHLDTLKNRFAGSVRTLNKLASAWGAMLMPAAMHPWMDPAKETRLWPHEAREIYAQFDKIFSCRRHGWANLQSCQINLPFCGDKEFARLHAAVRIVLPLLPALASSSPLMDGQTHGRINNRLAVYRSNSGKIPSITGDCIPEKVHSHKEYQTKILDPIYRGLKFHDPDGVLRHEWVNARGAIARFDRHAVEIRIMDMQECPAADIAVCKAVIAVIRALVEENFSDFTAQDAFSSGRLVSLLDLAGCGGELAVIRDRRYLALLGFLSEKKMTLRKLWLHLLEKTFPPNTAGDRDDLKTLRTILKEGVLSRRILRAAKNDFSRGSLREIYFELCRCLAEGRQFHA